MTIRKVTLTECQNSRAQAFRDVIEHLSPTTLAALSVELGSADCSVAAIIFRNYVEAALAVNVGAQEAEQLRMWVRDNI